MALCTIQPGSASNREVYTRLSFKVRHYGADRHGYGRAPSFVNATATCTFSKVCWSPLATSAHPKVEPGARSDWVTTSAQRQQDAWGCSSPQDDLHQSKALALYLQRTVDLQECSLVSLLRKLVGRGVM